MRCNISKASEQLRNVQSLLPKRAISLWDAEYGCAPFMQATADIPADKIIRMRPNLRLFGSPVLRKGQGRPPVHGAKFKFKDPDTWWQADADFGMLDPDLGKIRVRIWHDLHFRKAPNCPFRVACVERLESKGTRRLPKLTWIAWVGNRPLDEMTWSQYYLRRYAVDHWYRFAKQRLHWTLPRFSTPEQGQRWSDLMLFITWELWLARRIGIDKPLPLAEKTDRANPRPGMSGNDHDFCHDWHTCPAAETLGKCSRLAKSPSAPASTTLCRGQKDRKTALIGSLNRLLLDW